MVSVLDSRSASPGSSTGKVSVKGIGRCVCLEEVSVMGRCLLREGVCLGKVSAKGKSLLKEGVC